ncbi:MAG: hypothetical protein AAF802_07650 [Planctomycetota bacterium]
MRKLCLRFSLRTVIVVTLLFAAYFACWPATKDKAAADVSKGAEVDFRQAPEPIAPLFVRRTIHDVTFYSSRSVRKSHEYYFWCFGFTAKLYGPTKPVKLSSAEADRYVFDWFMHVVRDR